MKKFAMLLLLIGLLCLAGCGECEHEWRFADCENPKTCAMCGLTEGEALGHKYQEPDCENPKTCTVCNHTEGEALGHSWKDADCLTAKTCTVCAATEGDAKGHTMTQANYQAPATCTACGHTDGECLVPEFAEYNVNIITVEMGKQYNYLTECYIKGHTTVGKLWWEDYQVFASDENHEAVEGYEWHTVTVRIAFSDKDAQKYGFMVQPCIADYYWYSSETDNGYTDRFSVNFNGVTYDQCLLANGYGSVSDWVNNTCTYTATYAWRVPVGYDGHLILFYQYGQNLDELLANGDQNLLVFRFAA